MRTLVRPLAPLAALVASACVLPPPPGALQAPRVEVLADEARAAAYGRTATEVLRAPALDEGVRALFGANWGAGGVGGRGVSAPAPAFFASAPSVARRLRVDGTEWIGVTGCGAGGCASRAGVLLVRGDGAALLSRLDDGGFSHYYVFGTGLAATPDTRLLIDAVWRALGGPAPAR